ncbi:cbb3-type cytochrome c oxidase N-terminal domain-containing protein [Aeoliella mucimassa]|uniref:Cbb3-type cytochrome c oxidase subunit CcoP2 n=1 Tax=Aeoliella mucimassa TaxID=2527972 RepID=A0A518AM14_9BACT|nr:cbb3-type cytochrome c oxidase N-terminal domain-containing protein [Aeoliella mucimassa]QDU55756.1 Cbb3-type cytochrome c oxidase subunit CcoP2 [Aeoliella mucimassa]
MSDTPQNEPEVQEELLSSHNYDGIQEYDNPTPGWWNWLFIGSIVFTPIYVLWFHSPSTSRTLAAQYEDAKAANLKLQFGEIGDLEPTRENIIKFMDDDKWLAVGSATFATNCKSCHGADGEGISAPNMTDDYYINVKNIEDIAKVVKNGAKNGAMPAWGNRLHPNEVVLVSSYIASLRGENLPSARGAEGNIIPPWPDSVSDVESSSEEKADDTESEANAEQSTTDGGEAKEAAAE